MTDADPQPETEEAAAEAPQTVQPLPEALGTEDGDSWWLQGHVDKTTAVLAVLVEQATYAGPEYAGHLLRTGLSQDQEGNNLAENRQWAAEFVDRVEHGFWITLDDGERMVRCDRADPGAEAWTLVTVL